MVKTGELDLALVDMSMPGLSGIALIKRLKLEQPQATPPRAFDAR